MLNRPMPRAGLCALYLSYAACSSDHEPNVVAGVADAGTAGAASSSDAGRASAAGASGNDFGGSRSGNAGAASSSGGAAGSTAPAGAGGRAGPPPAVDGASVYALECHGDSKDCQRGTVPCLGVSSPTPSVAAGWACANRCASDSDCSDAPSGAEAQASCVALASTGHCLLVCRDENRTASCPDGMDCYVPPKSPIGYCLWQ